MEPDETGRYGPISNHGRRRPAVSDGGAGGLNKMKERFRTDPDACLIKLSESAGREPYDR